MKRDENYFADYNGFSVDSFKLQYLIEGYEKEVKEGQQRGLEEFWKRAKDLKEGGFRKSNEITADEWDVLIEAEDDKKENRERSLRAVQTLIEANPGVISLPFIHRKMISILHEYKASLNSVRLDMIRRVEWPNFLPGREGGKKYVSDESLRKRLKLLYEMPIEHVRTLLGNCMDLVNRGYDVGIEKGKLQALIDGTDGKRRMSKEFAIEIIMANLGINEKRLKAMRLKARPGRPKK